MAVWLLNGPTRKGERPKRVKTKKRTKRNPHLAVYANPPHKRHRKASSMARRRRSKTGRFVKGSTTHKRRSSARRRRRNPPYQFAAANPRRRRRRAAVSHRRRTYRRHRRNPGGKLLGISFPPMKRVLFGVGGAVSSSSIPQVIGKVFPSIPTAGPVGLAVRAAGGIIAGHFVGKFAGKEAGDDFALGSLIAVGNDAFHLFVAPSLGMSSYLAPSMRAYLAPGQNLLPARARQTSMSGVPTPTRFNSAARF